MQMHGDSGKAEKIVKQVIAWLQAGLQEELQKQHDIRSDYKEEISVLRKNVADLVKERDRFGQKVADLASRQHNCRLCIGWNHSASSFQSLYRSRSAKRRGAARFFFQKNPVFAFDCILNFLLVVCDEHHSLTLIG